jgi:prepilin-type processing-associated H-X9-DG protein
MMKRKGFTWLEAVAVIAILLIVAAILFPIFARSGEHAHNPSCQSNLKHIALGFKQYIQDYNERYPIAKNSSSGLANSDNWAGQLAPYLKSTQVFQCPQDTSATDNQKSNYGYNARMSKAEESKLNNSAIIILNYEVVADPNGWTQTGTGPQNVSASTRHLDGANYSFVDGHVKWLKPETVTALSPKQGSPTFIPG